MYGKTKFAAALPLALLFSAGIARAQEPNPTTVAPGVRKADVIEEGPNGIYIYHVKTVQRSLDAVNYLNRSGATHIGFQGTELLPNASGDAKVESVTGKTKISAKFEGLTPANGFGPEYLTYVIWAISADGRPQNLGELELSGNKANLDASTSFQSFGLIVTAEPYFSVSQPSDVVVLRNVFTDRTQGVLQQVNVHYALLPKGLYANTDGAQSVDRPITDREHYPLALFEAHNAARIARIAGADKYAADIMAEVATDLKNADDIQDSKHRDVKAEFTYAREATQRSEDARITTLRKQANERSRAEQQATADAQSQAAASQIAAANAQADADRAAAAKAQADAQRAQADAAAARAQADAAAANQRAASSEQSAEALRKKLRDQLNAVLVTTETARGLVVNIGDINFDTGKYTLKTNAQVSLAKIATIIALYPTLHIQVEGYTDSTGSPALNQTLSENRAGTVMQFLDVNGVPQANVTAQGYGATNFVGDNATAAGKAQNRRVDLVVSGDAIGVPTTAPTAATPSAQ